ncbi:MAG: NAD(P)H-dependent oxidoreductase [Actinomycetales bacterium]|jgi:NAD(P)H-dependent FMN reductase|nr:NAD(P)H-dependent oxidoreductase [Candidatus Phosphoribacter baldrii]
MSTPGAANAPGNPAPPSGQIELRIVVTSTRPLRLGPVVADWVRNHAPTDRFAVEVVDLAELNLPLLDEPEMASTGIYHHAHTRRWRELVTSADAIVWVMPEYNNGYPASIKNAIDYLYAEWEGKPMAIAGYGYRGAASATEQLTTVLRRVKATVVDGVGLRYRDHLDGPPGPDATVREDAELLGAVRRMYAALAAAWPPEAVRPA